MIKFTEEELRETLSNLLSISHRVKKVKDRFTLSSSQATLVKNRLQALELSERLIRKELKEDVELTKISKTDFETMIKSVISTIKKCEKALLKLNEKTYQYTLTRNMIKALTVASDLIMCYEKEVSEDDGY